MKTLFFIFVFFILSIFLSATIINVPADQPTIQEGINVAVDGDTVLIQPDTYVENINYNGKNITIASLFLTTQDTTYISQTIIDGNQDGSVVTFESGEDSTTFLNGLTITNGYSVKGGGIYCDNYSSPSLDNVTITGNSAGSYGGGIYCWDSYLSLNNVTIRSNSARYGGGIYCRDSDPSLENVTITVNSAVYGGGIYCRDSDPSLDNITITGNSASWWGGGISCNEYSSPSLENVRIADNSADYGGGIYCNEYSSPSLENVTITGNSATSAGGGIFNWDSYLSLENVRITGNSAVHDGGGICCWDSDPSLENVTITGNSATGSYRMGGGICCRDSDPSLENVTITGNSATWWGGGIYCHNSNLSLINSIVSDNMGNYGIYVSSSSQSITYSDFYNNENGNYYGCSPGTGCIEEDPLFVGVGDHPFMLQDLSPCVNSGIPDTTGLNLPEFDLAGNPRVFGGRIDMGAYENQNIFVNTDENLIPLITKLNQNYPNPFNPTTTINYSLRENSKVSLKIYNIKGQRVKQLVSDQLSAGQHSVVWNGKDENNKSVCSGIYFYKLKTSDFEKTRKMILLR